LEEESQDIHAEGDLMKVVVRAPLLSISGYGQHSRQVFEAVKQIPNVEIFTQIVQWGNTSWLINTESENGLVGEIMRKSSDLQSGFDVSFQVQLPDEWSDQLAKINVGVTAAVETDICNPSWIDGCNKMSAIIVPSKFTKGVLEKTGKVNPPIYVVPEWFMPEITDTASEIDLELRTPFNFLIVSQMTAASSAVDRKNIIDTIKWICETFENDKDVGLIIKTNSGRGTTIDKQITAATLQNVIKQVRSSSNMPVYLLHGNMTNEEISSLYRHPKVKALVSLTRGEGYGLPLLEAAASGLPVIATDWSAHTEFLNVGKWGKIEYSLIPIADERVDGRIFVKGSRWAQPSETNFKKKIKKFRESSEVPKQWANELKPKCQALYSKEKILSIYEHVFQEILK
jgi:glycosyltransferase involved in cell wall biosynthesis